MKKEEMAANRFRYFEVIGIFEIVDVGPTAEAEVCCGVYRTPITLRPIEIIKGSVSTKIIHYDFASMVGAPFVRNEKWLITLRDVDENGNAASGSCDVLVRKNIITDKEDADFYIQRFKELAKAAKQDPNYGFHWKSTSVPFVTISVPKCWKQKETDFSEMDDPPDEISIEPTDQCKDAKKGDWSILYRGPVSEEKKKIQKNFGAVRSGYRFRKELNLNGRIVRFYEDPHNHSWIANFNCGGAYFNLKNYGFAFGQKAPFAEHPNHEVPVVFKKFIESVKCDAK